jgi:hypothetical protein
LTLLIDQKIEYFAICTNLKRRRRRMPECQSIVILFQNKNRNAFMKLANKSNPPYILKLCKLIALTVFPLLFKYALLGFALTEADDGIFNYVFLIRRKILFTLWMSNVIL